MALKTCSLAEFERTVYSFVKESQAFVATSFSVGIDSPLLSHQRFTENCKGSVLGYFNLAHSVPVVRDFSLDKHTVFIVADNNRKLELEILNGSGKESRNV